MTGPTKTEQDWRALREWLIRCRTSAKKVADTAFDPRLQADQEAKWIAYSRVLDFMDERERLAAKPQARPGRKPKGEQS